jgi:hypothetical protein
MSAPPASRAGRSPNRYYPDLSRKASLRRTAARALFLLSVSWPSLALVACVLAFGLAFGPGSSAFALCLVLGIPMWLVLSLAVAPR